jgi:hypothetical protein
MLGDASARLSLPHLPGRLATKLAAAKNDPVQRARLLAEAAAGFPGRPDDFSSALAETRDRARTLAGDALIILGDAEAALVQFPAA